MVEQNLISFVAGSTPSLKSMSDYLLKTILNKSLWKKKKNLLRKERMRFLALIKEEKYFKDAEEAIQGGIDHKQSVMKQLLLQEVNAKLKEINTVEAVLMLISNCALLLRTVYGNKACYYDEDGKST